MIKTTIELEIERLLANIRAIRGSGENGDLIIEYRASEKAMYGANGVRHEIFKSHADAYECFEGIFARSALCPDFDALFKDALENERTLQITLSMLRPHNELFERGFDLGVCIVARKPEVSRQFEHILALLKQGFPSGIQGDDFTIPYSTYSMIADVVRRSARKAAISKTGVQNEPV